MADLLPGVGCSAICILVDRMQPKYVTHTHTLFDGSEGGEILQYAMLNRATRYRAYSYLVFVLCGTN